MIDIPKVTLYHKDAHGAMRYWAIKTKGFNIVMTHGQVGGVEQEQIEHIEMGAGGRTRLEQLHSRFNSRLAKKLDAGMVRDMQMAETQQKVNSLGLQKPMLAKPYKSMKSKIASYNEIIYAQRKYNGNRCMITNVDGVNIAYSRGGKMIHSVQHILDELEIAPGVIYDGELYIHGEALQSLRSLISRPQPDSEKLRFMCYDSTHEGNYGHRMRQILRNQTLKQAQHSVFVDTWVINKDQIESELDRVYNDGYEGLIVRLNTGEYNKRGSRDNQLIKVKKWLDEEFLIIDVVPSSEGWARFVCVTKEGKEFKVSAPGTISNRYKIMENAEKYKGLFIQCEFAEWTKDKKPSQPIALDNYRDKGAE